MAEPLLQVKNLCAGYGQVQVLWGTDLTVERGSIACLVGSNGAGKSTLLRAISGLIKPTGGRVHLGNRDLTNAAPDEILSAGIAHVPEGRRLFKGLSVRDNLLLGAYLRREPIDRSRTRSRKDLQAVSDSRRASASGCDDALWWRTADVCDRSRHDGPATAVDDRRALSWPGAARG